jgi:hypothetical protein
MATKNTTKAAVVEDETTETAELTPLQIVNEGIVRVIEAHGIDVQKNRYKAMRAIAWQAFVESIEAGDFDGLVERASGKVDSLPSGWEIEAPAKATPMAPVKKAAPVTKALVKAAAPRRRPATTKAATTE